MVITVFQRRTVLVKFREVKKIVTRSREEVAELRLELRSVSFNRCWERLRARRKGDNRE